MSSDAPAQAPQTSAPRRAAAAIAALARPPYRGLVALGVLLSLASRSIPEDAEAVSLLSALVFIALSAYVQLATTLAAGAGEPDPALDHWIRAAVAARTFWRFVAAGLLMMILVAIGGLGVVVGAFVVAGIVGLAEPAAALERQLPADSIRRSAELSRGSRGQIAFLFGIFVIVPAALGFAAAQLEWDRGVGVAIALAVGVNVLASAGVIALTRVFVERREAMNAPAATAA